jgi:UDP-glucuronate 4-epimerase
MEYRDSAYEVINLGNNQTVSLHEMVEGLEHALRVKAVLEKLPEQPGDVPQTWASVDKAHRLLGYQPSTAYVDGVVKFAEWLQLATPA